LRAASKFLSANARRFQSFASTWVIYVLFLRPLLRICLIITHYDKLTLFNLTYGDLRLLRFFILYALILVNIGETLFCRNAYFSAEIALGLLGLLVEG
jgi:hypothetical protein